MDNFVSDKRKSCKRQKFTQCMVCTKNQGIGTSMAVQWLRLHASRAGGAGSIPGWGSRILHAVQCSQNVIKKKKKKELEDYIK